MLPLGGQDRGHCAVGMEFLPGVADMLSDRMDADGEAGGNIRGPHPPCQQAEHLVFPGGDRQGFALAGAGSLDGSFVEHVDQDGPVLVVVGYERDNRYLLSLSGGALHPGLGRGRDVSGPGGGYGRTVAGAERDGPFQRQACRTS